MRKRFTKIAFSAALGLAMALTFGCSDDKEEQIGTSSSGGNASVSSSSVTGSGGSSSSAGNNGNTYKTVVIGTQTWMAENLNYDVSGSVCYDNDPANCAKYGRLYDWATAMAFPSKCNSTLSTSDADCTIRTPNHQGICPSGWHIPSNADWDRLYRYADGTSGTSSPYYSETAGRYLKAKEGWNSCGPSGSGKSYLCEDTYGFSALPGGYGFGVFGEVGYWRSASEHDSSNAYFRRMDYDIDVGDRFNDDKDALVSVRCVQD